MGANIMRGHDVVFDVKNGTAGFAESNCNYNRATKEKEEEKEERE